MLPSQMYFEVLNESIPANVLRTVIQRACSRRKWVFCYFISFLQVSPTVISECAFLEINSLRIFIKVFNLSAIETTIEIDMPTSPQEGFFASQ